MVRRIIVPVFARNRYSTGTASSRSFSSRDREKLLKLFGGATKVVVQGRVYDRSSTSAVLDFTALESCLGNELPSESLRQFSPAISGDIPSLPWNNTNMPSLPDDGTFAFSPGMGLCDLIADVSGGAGEWVEFELWASVEVDA